MKSSARNSEVALQPLTRRAYLTFARLVGDAANFGVAVSGGSDSMALLMMAASFRDESGIPFRVATVDHGLRPEAKAEAHFVAEACARLDAPHATLKWDRGATSKSVSQMTARRARHTLLARWASDAGVTHIAFGHTRDDRLETFLMRARQGSGWHGLAGPMPNGPSPVWPEGRGLIVVRPLLAFGREDLREELRARGHLWVEDPSNAATRFERVRMRNLLARMNPAALTSALAVMDHLGHLRAAVILEARTLLDGLVHAADGRGAEIALEARSRVGAEAWLRLIEAMVMAAGGGEGPPRRDALNRLLAGMAAPEGQLQGGVTLAGAKIRIRKGGILSISRAPPRRTAAPSEAAEKPDWERVDALLTPPLLDP